MRRWKLAVALARAFALVVAVVAANGAPLDARPQPAFTHARLVTSDGDPRLLVDGRPYFIWGAAFFYERIPPGRWRASMLALRALGCNTLDLYVPWNWHEVSDGRFDFNGRTNPRRNLRRVLRLAATLHFRLVVRPGPVIRNEWRNGGYPAWLLRRPAYGMPLHDVLEGRYPATATLQNAQSDAAAAQWLANGVHRRYATRWLRTVLREFRPVADRVIAVQLDDDQGAYIDNATWPAPHFQRYLRLLATTVRGVVGARLPLFINTYEMKVTASAPVWAMGNWYESDAYAFGEHDRASLEFATALLQTQTRGPVAISEFQAGWLAAPEDPAPRPADPANTTLALHTLLGMGARGVIDFPMQDTVNPPGWEAPFANIDYAWDAALDMQLRRSPRWRPTASFGALVGANGALLADAHRLSDGAIAALISAADPRRLTNAGVFAIVARTQDEQRRCRALRLTCDLVDLRFAARARLARYRFIALPWGPGLPPIEPAIARRLVRYAEDGGRVVLTPPRIAHPRAGGIPNAALLIAAHDTAFLDIVNDGVRPQRVARTRLHLPDGRMLTAGPLVVPPRDAVLLRASRDARFVPAPAAPIRYADPPACRTLAHVHARDERPAIVNDDRAQDGEPRITLRNGLISFTIVPAAGARALWFGAPDDRRCGTAGALTSVGALRDDAAIAPPLSTTDKIGAYTRSFPAGTFNRTYRIVAHSADANTARVTVAYDAPDVVPAGARFERTLELRRGERAVTVTERFTPRAGRGADAQRQLRYDSFDMRGKTLIDARDTGAIGFFDPLRHTVALVAWPRADVEAADILPQRTSDVVRLRFTAGGDRRTRYALVPAYSLAAARAALRQERAVLEANSPHPRGRGEMVDAVASKATE